MEIGEWVIVKDYYGFVLEKKESKIQRGPLLRVYFRAKQNEWRRQLFKVKNVTKAPDLLDDSDLYALQHLALATNDKAWFEALGQRKKTT
ncbi:hypothetical protein [Priestia koreensis]|uniref:hypothetical protein n=1 Tax=Priestia koreensis TaxID=284581 RepID=UPI001F5A601F|nr:hypothetical protein [Priestia koreensis]UNL83205.1 hypothetical protein IE339_13495 [Priestia koreensis]